MCIQVSYCIIHNFSRRLTFFTFNGKNFSIHTICTFYCMDFALVRHIIKLQNMNKERGKKASTVLRSLQYSSVLKWKFIVGIKQNCWESFQLLTWTPSKELRRGNIWRLFCAYNKPPVKSCSSPYATEFKAKQQEQLQKSPTPKKPSSSHFCFFGLFVVFSSEYMMVFEL